MWLFGYGSLIWRPDFPFRNARTADVSGWARRFWQGSHDHRGTPDAPGRVVTLAAQLDAVCRGVAYDVAAEDTASILANLDYREKNGYRRIDVDMTFPDGTRERGTAYIATPDNSAYLGEAPMNEIAEQIRRSHGPSGANADYLFALADALRRLDAADPHVFELETLLRGD